MRQIFSSILIALLGLSSVSAQQQTISGYVRDAKTGESLIGARVSLPEIQVGTLTNNYGFYSLKATAGIQRLQCHYVGYMPLDTVINVSNPLTININLHQQARELSEVSVVGRSSSPFHTTETGAINLSPQELQHMPAMLGEPDIIKYAQLMPGVARGHEGITGMVVRGGDADQNLYLIDGNPLYNINHLFGLFSTFNPDAIKTAKLYKGSFPARFGGRLSSVLDVRTIDGDKEKFSGALTIGLISSRLTLQGPIIKGKTSYSFSIRRTYLDLVAKPFINLANKSELERNNPESSTSEPGYHFYDANLKLNHKIDDRNSLYLSLYTGKDNLSLKSVDYSRERQDSPLLETSNSTLGMNWGNQLATLGWTHVWSPSLFSITTIYAGKYNSQIKMDAYDYRHKDGKKHLDNFTNYHLTSSISDIGLRSQWDYRPNNTHYIRFGNNIVMHQFKPNIEGYRIGGDDLASYLGDKSIKRTQGKPINSRELSLFGEDEIEITNKLSSNIGVHASALSVEGQQYYSFEPRISTRYLLTPKLCIKGSYSRMTQYIHLLQSTALSLPTDVWMPVTKRVRPMIANQYAMGLFYDLKGYDLSLEGYYKDLHHIIAYKDGVPLFIADADWQDRIAAGNGRAYGVELMAKKNEGRLTGWIAYTLSWADRIFPGGEVNLGKRFLDKYDNRHKLNIVMMYKLSKNVEASAIWAFSSGNRMSLQTKSYLNPHGKIERLSEERNNFQLPNYHRLDIGLNIYRPKKNGRMGIWRLGIYNIYMHHNAFMIDPGSMQQDEQNPRARRVKSISPFSLLPSIAYTYKF